MGSRRIQQALAWTLAVSLIAVPVAARQPVPEDAAALWAATVAAAGIDPPTAARVAAFAPGLSIRRARLDVMGRPLDLIVLTGHTSIESSQHLVDANLAVLARLADWFGPLPRRALIVVDVPWHAGVAGASYPGVVVTSTRWLSTPRDFRFERPLIAALARQYTFGIAGPGSSEAWFEEGVALYAGTRATHEALEGRNFSTLRYFGGFVPFSLRSVLLSPSPTDPRPRLQHLAEVEHPANAPWRAASAAPGGPAQRAALALHTLERYLGWPAFQAALSTFTERFGSRGASAADFAAVVSEQRGTDVSWFAAEALRAGARFDYAIATFESKPGPAGAEAFQTGLVLQRRGDGVFAGTSRPRGEGMDRARSLPVLIRFGDGTEITEWWDGRDAEQHFQYASATRATIASVDPDAVLLLDEDRTNNTKRLDTPLDPTGVKLALSWLLWLQGAMLTYTALL